MVARLRGGSGVPFAAPLPHLVPAPSRHLSQFPSLLSTQLCPRSHPNPEHTCSVPALHTSLCFANAGFPVPEEAPPLPFPPSLWVGLDSLCAPLSPLSAGQRPLNARV